MGDQRWPADVKPLINKNYSFGRGKNVLGVDVDGGLPRNSRNRTFDTPTFKLNFTISPFVGQMLDYFYNKLIDSGANSFYINLDSGRGIQEHHGVIVPGTWSMVRPNNGHWNLAFDFLVEYLPQEREEECSNAWDIFQCYGLNAPSIVGGVIDLVEEWPGV